MNKIVLPLPSFPDFKIIEVDILDGEVYFGLEHGVCRFCCKIDSKIETDVYCVPVDNDPQNDVDRDFEYRVVDIESPIIVIDIGDVDLVDGQKLQLTEKQCADLNEELKEMKVMV